MLVIYSRKSRAIAGDHMTTPHSLDGFLIASTVASSPCFVGVNGIEKASYHDVEDILRSLKSNGNFSVYLRTKGCILTCEQVPESFLEENGLHRIESEVDERSFHHLLKRRIVSDFSHPDFHSHKGGIRKRQPIKSSSTINQFLHYKLSFSTVDGRTMFRPDSVTRYETTRFMNELSDQEIRDWESNDVHVDGKHRTYRFVRALKLEDVPQQPGSQSIAEIWRTVNHRITRALDKEPNMLCAEIQVGDYYRRGSGAITEYAPLCALKQVVTMDDIPENEMRLFMPQSHVALQERFNRSQEFVDILDASYVSPALVTSRMLGYEEHEFVDSLVVMGDNQTVNSIDPVGIWRALRSGSGIHKQPQRLRIGCIPVGSSSSQWQKFTSAVRRDLESLRLDPTFVECDPIFSKDGLSNRYELQQSFQKIRETQSLDTLLIELPEYSPETWRKVKRAGKGAEITSQLVTSAKTHISSTSFNVSLGLVSAAGGVPLGLRQSRSGIDIWIGIDIARDGKKNVAAASVAFNAHGTQVGHVNSVPVGGERIEDEAFQGMIEDLLEGLLHHGVISGNKVCRIGILRDGWMNESLRILDQIESIHNVEFTAISFLKRNQARIAAWDGTGYTPANAGLALVSQDSNSALIQTNQQRKGALGGSPTIKKLSIERGAANLEEVAEDVFWLCKINAASTQQPGTPIPIHYAHKLADQSMKGLGVKEGFHTDLGFL